MAIDERTLEEQHLMDCISIIKKNIDYYSAETATMDKEIQEMYDSFHSDNPEMYTMLGNTVTMNDTMKLALRKNINALPKPYFGRIDYVDKEMHSEYSLYLGKHGVEKSLTEQEVVDWRAPIATVYYDNDLGDGMYRAPHGEIEISLNRKRTYEIDKSELVDFYDSEYVANDELLTKYLAKNKEAVLGEIIATIQKEQNEIIRQTPFHSVIVQGVAGSGKTTVAMHRISYLLYNYAEKIHPSEFFIIGSNQMLLRYITAVLPDLDVHNVNQMTMEEFFIRMLEEDYDKKKYKLFKGSDGESDSAKQFASFRGSLLWMKALDDYVNEWELKVIPVKEVKLDNELLYTADSTENLITENPQWSVQQKRNILNMRLDSKLRNLLSGWEMEPKEIRAKMAPFKNYFGPKNWKGSLYQIYYEFLMWLQRSAEDSEPTQYGSVLHGITNLRERFDILFARLEKKQLDIYDLASLAFFRRRMKLTEEITDAKHMVVDEAQDYGSMVFGILKRIMPACNYTIMGDVSQNINYSSGMNDWEALRKQIFDGRYDYFAVLAKSYRNTIEISQYACDILKKCSFEMYPIEPLIRHGRPVEIKRSSCEKEMLKNAADRITGWQKEGYDTIAVICKDMKEAMHVQKELGRIIKVDTTPLEEATFSKGVMVLPIQLTKGLEFDTVLLWNPDSEAFPSNDANGKLLYVAATRALHELSVMHYGELSKMLEMQG